ncbi:MAG: Mpo1-like protein [Alphaproteobacteria bacterium]
MSDRIKSYKEFWPYYLREHSKPATRKIHLAGTASAIGLIGLGVVTGQPWLPLAGLGAGYGSAWTAHAFVEKNKPATFKYPLWSLVSDFKMLGHWMTGTLQSEVDKHIGPQAVEARHVPPAKSEKSFMQRVKGLKQQFTDAISFKKKAPEAKPAPQPKPPGPKP